MTRSSPGRCRVPRRARPCPCRRRVGRRRRTRQRVRPRPAVQEVRARPAPRRCRCQLRPAPRRARRRKRAQSDEVVPVARLHEHAQVARLARQRTADVSRPATTQRSPPRAPPPLLPVRGRCRRRAQSGGGSAPRGSFHVERVRGGRLDVRDRRLVLERHLGGLRRGRRAERGQHGGEQDPQEITPSARSARRTARIATRAPVLFKCTPSGSRTATRLPSTIMLRRYR